MKYVFQLHLIANYYLQNYNLGIVNKEELKFKIDQLRKDKIIYGVEAVATDLAVMLAIYFVDYFGLQYSSILIFLLVLTGVGYTVFMGVTNFNRLQKIKELEKKL